MTHSRSQFLMAATIVGLTLASAAEAQGAGGQGPRPPVGQRGSAPGGMMPRRGPGGPGGPPGVMGERGERPGRGARGNPAAMLLRLRTALSLTDDQVKKLEALQSVAAPKSNASDLLRARADLMDAMQGDGNLTKARAALDRMSALRNERVIGGLKLRQDARAVLNAEQRTTLDNMRKAMRGEARDKMRGTMRNNGRAGGRGVRRGGPQRPLGPGGAS
ncbi:Spy/CpxP family protein refolding chaperone [Gemmatimonas sp.]|jgi:Spy/CpxP family protein refolding chaperone|uniref:Spy/CpxP family protein refolding chaperone n=1 Tax=Gemmatimonas sp. TaxID=1962908 RepID=UPI0037C14D1D